MGIPFPAFPAISLPALVRASLSLQLFSSFFTIMFEYEANNIMREKNIKFRGRIEINDAVDGSFNQANLWDPWFVKVDGTWLPDPWHTTAACYIGAKQPRAF
jgi:hypothetical protein